MSAQNVLYGGLSTGDTVVEPKFCEICGRMFTRPVLSGIKCCPKHNVAFPDTRDIPVSAPDIAAGIDMIRERAKQPIWKH